MLTGWKDITAYTGLSRYTIKRLAAERGFPLRYVATRPVIVREEVQQWLTQQPNQVTLPSRKSRRRRPS